MENKDKSLALADLKRMLEDCFPANPRIYWLDLLATAFIGWGSFVAVEILRGFPLAQAVFFLISVFAIYRGMLFIHELTHQERKDLPGFSVAWNLLFGVPALFPSFMYRGVHIDHHKKTSYATNEDGEYLPLGAAPFWKTIAYIGQSFFLPALVVVRFGLLTPLSFLHPKIREQVMRKASALAIRFDVARKIPSGMDLRNWVILEWMCFFWVAFVASLFLSGILGWGTLTHIYLTMVAMFLVNSVRTVVAHRYRNASAEPLSFQDQLLDSVNLEGNVVVAEIVAPVGLRYHALHHLFPTIPYHNLGIAHRRLRANLPSDSFYHECSEASLWSAFQTHWKNTHSELSAKEAAARLL